MSKVLLHRSTDPSGKVGGVTISKCVLVDVDTWRCTMSGSFNNYGTKSSSFHNMNNLVNYLDANFKTLPTVTQDAWQAESDDHDWWAQCGCQGDLHNGQSLYRGTNVNRFMLGLPQVDTPPLDDNFIQCSVDVFFHYPPTNPGGARFVAWAGGFPIAPLLYVLLQNGKGLNTRMSLDIGSGSVTWFPGDPIFDEFYPSADASFVKWCVCTNRGYPLTSSASQVQWQP